MTNFSSSRHPPTSRMSTCVRLLSDHTSRCRTGMRSWRRPALQAAATLLCLTPACCHSLAADEILQQESAPQTGRFGPPQILSEHLVRVREVEALARTVRLHDDGTFPEEALLSLETFFAYPTDLFRLDQETWQSHSLRAELVQLLRQSAPIAQRQWSQAVSTVAASQLKEAIVVGDRTGLQQVARRFPLTESGIRAALLVMSLDSLKGRDQQVSDSLRQLQNDTLGTIQESFFLTASQALRARLKTTTGEEARHAAAGPERNRLHSVQLSVSPIVPPGTISSPWPRPNWNWTESVWTFPGVRQPQAGTALDPFLPTAETHLNDFTNWRPVFWGDTVVHRSPFRLIAFNRKTGSEEWSLITDSFVPEQDAGDSHGNGNVGETNSDLPEIVDDAAAVSGFSAYGLLSFDEEFLYFIDGFEFFSDPFDGNLERRTRRFFLPGQSNRDEAGSRSKVATRLVAMRRTPNGGVPVIAWISGEPHSFSYEFQKPQPAAENSTTADNTEAPKGGIEHSPLKARASESGSAHLNQKLADADEKNVVDPTEKKTAFSLVGHRFLSPPVGSGQQLFVLTRADGMLLLNCLARGTGEIEWQQPLAFSDNWATRFQEISNPASSCSVCLISGENVICSLSSGLVMAVRASDGQLQWAAAVRDVELQQGQRGFRMPLDEPEQIFIDSPGILIPFANEDVVVCSDSRSLNVAGINTQTGEILWQTPRRAFGPGDVGNSYDLYIAGLSGNQVIMVGERHCRSLDLQTGDQNWVVPVMRSTGRAECRGDRCLIPQSDGRTLMVNLKDGTAVRQRHSFLPEDAVLQYGAITSDDDIVCVSTPVSLSVFPRADALQQPPATIHDKPTHDKLTADNTTATLETVRQNVQANLLDGNESAAVEILKAAISQQSADRESKTSAQLQRYLGELILQDWGAQWADQDLQASALSSPASPIGDYAKLLPELELTSEQHLRAAVLSVLGRPDATPDAEEREQLAAFKDWKLPVTITADWKVRSDLLLNDAGKSLASDGREIEKLSLVKVQRLAEDVALFPELTSDTTLKETLVARLLALGNYAAAEAIAIKWQQQAEGQGTHDPTAAVTLAKLRNESIAEKDSAQMSDATAAQKSDTAGTGVADTAAADTGISDKTDGAGLSTHTQGPLVFQSKMYLGVPDWDLQRVEKGLAINSLPDWVRLRHYLVDGQSGLPDLVSVDMSDGSLRDRLSLPFAAHRNIVSFRGLSNGRATPGLLPLVGADQISMISCSLEEKASILWTRRFRKVDIRDTADIPIEFGPLGPDFFIWHAGDELHCSHPLSGRDLWVRQLKLSPANTPFAGVRKIFGDGRAISVMGADLASVERFSTRDGRRLKSTRLSISRVNDAVTVGGCLLYPDATSQLHCYSSATGEDLLAGQPPIRLNRINPDSNFHVLSEGRVVTVSSDLEVVLIDTNSGKIVFRTPAREQIATGSVFGITAFERFGKLFVGIEEQRDIRLRSVEMSFRPREPRLQAGPLICMDPETGRIEWSMPLESAGIPIVYGDPTDLMLIWTNPKAEDETEITNHKINLRLVNSRTGVTVATEDSISASRPLRCTHIAEKQSIEVMTRDTLITVQPQAIAGEVPQE